MNITEAIRNRRSIRKYKEGIAIPEQDIHAILEAAMMAPSARNTRPWEFIVIKDAGVQEKTISVHPYAKHLREASLGPVPYTHLRAHEPGRNLVCRLLLEKKNVCKTEVSEALRTSSVSDYGMSDEVDVLESLVIFCEITNLVERDKLLGA